MTINITTSLWYYNVIMALCFFNIQTALTVHGYFYESVQCLGKTHNSQNFQNTLFLYFPYDSNHISPNISLLCQKFCQQLVQSTFCDQTLYITITNAEL